MVTGKRCVILLKCRTYRLFVRIESNHRRLTNFLKPKCASINRGEVLQTGVAAAITGFVCRDWSTRPSVGGCTVGRQRQTRRNARVRCVFGCARAPTYLFRRDLLRRAAPSCTTTLECNPTVLFFFPPSFSFTFSFFLNQQLARMSPFVVNTRVLTTTGLYPGCQWKVRGMFKRAIRLKLATTQRAWQPPAFSRTNSRHVDGDYVINRPRWLSI